MGTGSKSVKLKGEVKYSGIECGSIPWKTGALEISNTSGPWKCNLYFDASASKGPVKTYELSAKKIHQVIYKARFLLQLKNQMHIHFKPRINNELGKLKEVLDEILGQNTGENSLRTPEKVQKGTRTPGKTVPLLFNGNTDFENYLTDKSVNSTPENRVGKDSRSVKPVRPTSSSPFGENNASKENSTIFINLNGDEKEDDAFDIFEESKENKYSGPVSSISPEQFLKRGNEKSRETLKSIATGGFYSTAKCPPTNMFTYSKPTSKRSLGFMPDPTPLKKFKFSDCTYSWSKNKSSPKVEPTKTSSLHGFSNLGNTCYMNATLQSLFGLDTFSTDLIYSNQQHFKSLSHDSLYYHLARLLKARKNLTIPDSMRRDFLRNVKRAISTSAKRFSGYQQHDAHEFLGQVLDQLKEEVIKLEKSRSVSSPKETNNNNNNSTTPDFINPTVQNFEFEVLHTIKCVRCNEEVEKQENFNDLSLDMSKRLNNLSDKSIQDAVNIFLDKEEIDYTCSKCNHNRSLVSHRFSTLPRILVLHLKRNSYNTSLCKNGKVLRSVRIPQQVSLSYFCTDETVPCHTAPESIPNYRFKKRSTSLDGLQSKLDEDIIPLPDDWDDVLKQSDKKEEDDIAKAIELSLQQHKHNSTVETEDEQLEKVLEMSLREDQRNTSTDLGDICENKELAKLTEEERIDLAIQQSLLQAEQESMLNTDSTNTSIDSQLDTTEVDLTCSEDKENLFDDNSDTNKVESYSSKNFECEKDLPYTNYRLVSIVNHIGSSSETGHYISDVFDMKKFSWMSFDDSRVTPLTESEVYLKREKSGYIFFYMNQMVFDEMRGMYQLNEKN